MTKATCRRRGSQSRVFTVALPGMLLGAMIACKGILDVQLPSKVTESALTDPSIAATLVTSALGAFDCAFTNYVPATGEITDELRHSSAWATYTYWDHRLLSPVTDDGAPCEALIGYGVYLPLQQARFIAEDASKRISAWSDAQVPRKAEMLATLAAYSGYTRTLLGEGFCEMAIDLGPRMTPAEVLSSAEQKFTDAITAARSANSTPILNMALVGRARVRLDLGKTQEAVADASQVPQGFVFNSTHSAADPTRYNKIYGDNWVNGFISISREFIGLTFGGVPDPRVKTDTSANKAHDQSILVLQHKYTAYNSPIPIATWQEAQLIIAEVQGGQTAVNIINTLHALAGLPPFSSSDPVAITNQVRQERSRELFLDGHRLYDMIRWNLPFATGQSPYDGVTYGTTTCMPLPESETNGNPNLRP